MHSLPVPAEALAAALVGDVTLCHNATALLAGPVDGNLLVASQQHLCTCTANTLLQEEPLLTPKGLLYQIPAHAHAPSTDPAATGFKKPMTPCIHLVAAAPEVEGASLALAAVAYEDQISVIAAQLVTELDNGDGIDGRNGFGSTSDINSKLAPRHTRTLGIVAAPCGQQWRSASWHSAQAGLLAIICQAELRVLVCTAGAEAHSARSPADDGAGQALAPPAPRLSTGNIGTGLVQAASVAPRSACRSPMVHVAWVGHGHSLLAAWGAELEVITWQQEKGASHGAWGNAPVAVRRSLLLGVAGPLRALAQGPNGSLVASLDAQLSLSLLRQQPAALGQGQGGAGVAGSARQADGNGGEEAGLDGDQGTLDLRGRFSVPYAGLDGQRWAGSETLAGLMSLSLDGSGGAGRAGRVAAVPSALLLQGEAAGAAADAPCAQLLVIWPQWLSRPAEQHQQATATTVKQQAASGSYFPGGGSNSAFHSSVDLMLPRPDLLTASHQLVLAATSCGPPLVQAFAVSEHRGLHHLCNLTLQPPLRLGLPLSCCRLRGVRALPAGANAAAGEAGAQAGAPGTPGAACHVVALLGVMPNGTAAPFTSLSSTAGGGTATFSPLLACIHPLPPRLAALAAPPATPQPPAAAAQAASAAPPANGSAQGAAAPPAAAAAASGDAATAQLLSQLVGMVSGLQQSMDRRLDAMDQRLNGMDERLRAVAPPLVQQQPGATSSQQLQ